MLGWSNVPWSRIAAVLGVVAVLLIAPAGPAAATTCAGWRDGVARQAVSGELPSGRIGRTSPRPFTEQFDYALIGEVTAVHGPSPLGRLPGVGDDGAKVEVAVRAGFFAPAVPSRVQLSMSDAGQLNGYPFEVGRRYFIPVKSVGPQGLRDYVMLCDPVVLVDDDEQATLIATARSAGTTLSTVGATTTDDTSPWSTRRWLLLGGGAAALALTLLTRRRRKAA